MSLPARWRALAGFTWLDENFRDHVETVDLKRLRVSMDNSCPLAQASGGRFTLTRARLGLSMDWAVKHGFMARPDGEGSYFKDWLALQAAWEDLYGEAIARTVTHQGNPPKGR